MTDSNDPTEIFRAEARELFEQLETTLLDVEADPSNKELINTVFRALHTIKGSGAMFGFEAVSAFTHHVENAFDLVRKDQLAVSKQLIELALEAKDHIRTLIEQPEDEIPGRSEEILAQLAGLIGVDAVAAESLHKEAPKIVAPPARTTWRIHFRLAPDAITMGANPLLLLKEMYELGDCTIVTLTGDIPPLAQMDPEVCYLSWECVLSTDQPRSAGESLERH
jgi:two-component system, chemotaxis family, sensor kinase CheA